MSRDRRIVSFKMPTGLLARLDRHAAELQINRSEALFQLLGSCCLRGPWCRRQR
jgi:hypothetical protein